MPQHTTRRRAAMAELMIPLAAIAFTAYYMWSVREGPWEAQFSAYFVGTSLLVACTAFVANRAWRWLRADWSHLAGAVPVAAPVTVRRLALLAMTLGYVLMVDFGVGFTLSSFVFLTVAITLLRGTSHLLRAGAIALTLSLAGYLLFIVAFDTRFPEGPVERLLAGLFG